jgi:peptidoglycan-associated lipoprotein
VAAAEPSSSAGTCGLVRVHFEFDKADLSDNDKTILKSTAGCLKKDERLRVSIEGNADERGTHEYNDQLGEQRARAVSQYLEQQGVSAGQVSTISHGKDNPLCRQSDEECWARNRRTAIRPTCHM